MRNVMRGMMRAVKHDSRGANLLEMAMLMLVLLVILAGLVDIGRVWHSWVVIINASREGARHAARFPWMETEIKQVAIQETSDSGVQLYEANVTVIGLNATGGQPIRVKVTYPFHTIMGSVINVGSVITLTGTTEMIVFGGDA